jgi:phage baseplate assembly protein W
MSATILVSTREFKDVDFSFAKHPASYNILVKKNSNAVRQSVMHLLRLRSGDIPFHPEIRSPIYEFMFDNATSVAKIVMESEVRKYLEVYEPRLLVDDVKVTFEDNNSINCVISGTIINVSSPITINVLVNAIR